jgi:hypothetical protein
MQYIPQFYVNIYTSANVLYRTLNSPFVNPNNNTLANVTIPFLSTHIGTYYFNLMNGNVTLNSSIFNVTQPT